MMCGFKIEYLTISSKSTTTEQELEPLSKKYDQITNHRPIVSNLAGLPQPTSYGYYQPQSQSRKFY